MKNTTLVQQLHLINIMATVESLDLASLQNNPQSIAEALEDALETTDGTIGTLKTNAQSKKDDIDDLYDDALVAKNSIDAILTNASTVQTKRYTSNFDGSWTTENMTGAVSDEHGINITRWGYLWVITMAMYSTSVTLGNWEKIMTVSSSDFDLPSNDVRLGNYIGEYYAHQDYMARLQLQTDGEIYGMPITNSSNSNFFIVGTFVGIDAS